MKEWLTLEEVIDFIMKEHSCSLEEAKELAERFKREHPEAVETVEIPRE